MFIYKALSRVLIVQEHEKGKLDEERKKVIDRTKAIIEQAEKTRNSAVAGDSFSTVLSPACRERE